MLFDLFFDHGDSADRKLIYKPEISRVGPSVAQAVDLFEEYADEGLVNVEFVADQVYDVLVESGKVKVRIRDRQNYHVIEEHYI